MRPQHNPLFGFPLVMCFQKLPVFTLLGDSSVVFQALFFIFWAHLSSGFRVWLAVERQELCPLRDIMGDGCQAEQG